jgi:hypothetical protein
MVSYPDDAPSRLPFRPSVPGGTSHTRSPSIASSSRAPSISTTVRRHRHGRSHAGGGSSSRSVKNEFPIFAATGDVEIVITERTGRREQRYVLHRLYLAQCSGFFEAGMSEEWSGAASNGGAAAGPVGSDGSSSASRSSSEFAGKRWKYELDWGANGEEIPMLVQKVRQLPSELFETRLWLPYHA